MVVYPWEPNRQIEVLVTDCIYFLILVLTPDTVPVVAVLVATLNRTPLSNKAINLCHHYYTVSMHLLLLLTKGHLSIVAIISC